MDLNQKSKVLLQKIKLELKNNGSEFCIYHSPECTDQIVKAHSIQNKQVLSILSNGTGHIVMPTFDEAVKFENVGVNNATVFKGLCSRHDNDLFEYIDNSPYGSLDSERANFLYALRALLKEFYTKKNIVIKHNINFKLFDDGQMAKLIQKYAFLSTGDLYNLFGPDSDLRSMVEGNEIALKEQQSVVDYLKLMAEKSQFHRVKSKCYSFRRTSLAVSTMFAPEFNSKGRRINKIENLFAPLRNVYVTVLPLDEETKVIISYLKKEECYLKEFLDDLDEMDAASQGRYLWSIILGHCENVVFSKSLKDNLGANDQEKLYSFFRENGFGSVEECYRTDNEIPLFFVPI